MVSQLPEGSEGVAAASVIFACISVLCSSMVIWLTAVHNESRSYVALLAYFTLISTTASLIQQIHVIAFYRDIEVQQYEARVKDPFSPDARVANGSTGMDLILYYIQFYCYQTMSLLILWWASELAQSVYGLLHKGTTRRILRKVNAAGKITAIVIPLIIILLLRAPPVQKDPLVFTVITDIPLGLAMGLGSILMLVILGRYIYSRRKLLRFDAGQGASTDPESQTSSSNAGSRYSRYSRATKPKRNRVIYDRWIMTRFTAAFFFLCIFQATATLFQQLSIGNFDARLGIPGPDFSVEKARKSLLLFIPGNLPGIALFLVFGTTTAFRRYMRERYSATIKWIKAIREPKKRAQVYPEMPTPRMGYQPHIYAARPDLMKTLPHRPDSSNDDMNTDVQLQEAEKAIVHEGNTIFVMRELSVQRSSRYIDQRMPTDSTKDSTPSLIIMRQSTEDERDRDE